MKYLNQEIENKLKNMGGDFVSFVNISNLTNEQNRGFPYAILVGIAIHPKFIKDVFNNPDHVNILDNKYMQTENKAGKVADELTEFLVNKGHKAISQSDAGLLAEGMFNFETKTSVLPHKTIALLSGLGWIGKNNLFITPQYGAAQCLGTVLTDAPLRAALHEPLLPKCGNCNICSDSCEKRVLKGKTWHMTIAREEIIDVYGCDTCLKCLVHCPVTQAYIKNAIIQGEGGFVSKDVTKLPSS